MAHERTKEELLAEMEEMSLGEIIKFAQDFAIVPQKISVLQLAQVFRIVNRTGALRLGSHTPSDMCTPSPYTHSDTHEFNTCTQSLGPSY